MKKFESYFWGIVICISEVALLIIVIKLWP